ncbi:MFS transporter [Streptomyces olivaceiscleroticus]
MVLAGAAQPFANPATNRLIAAHLPAKKRATAIGIKQSGVQFGAFAAGLLLPALAGFLSWRVALAAIIPVALAAAVVALRRPRDKPRPSASPAGLLPQAPDTTARWLILYSLGIGTGLAALSTYLRNSTATVPDPSFRP